jgi:hypothetical protein
MLNIFRIFSGKQQPPAVRDFLFGDLAIDQWPIQSGDGTFPWSAFVTARAHLANRHIPEAIDSWRQVLASPDLEPRHYLQAWHFLRQHDVQPPKEIAKKILGAVVEVGMPKGLDILAAYVDHSARYYNFSGAGIVWERPEPSLDALIDKLLGACSVVVNQIGPWNKNRPSPPPDGQVRLSFLTPSGLHFGQGVMNDMAQNELGGPVIQAAIQLMQALTLRSGF